METENGSWRYTGLSCSGGATSRSLPPAGGVAPLSFCGKVPGTPRECCVSCVDILSRSESRRQREPMNHHGQRRQIQKLAAYGSAVRQQGAHVCSDPI